MEDTKQGIVADHKKNGSRAFWRRKWTLLDLRNAFIILLIHSACIFAPFHFTWPLFWFGFAVFIAAGLFGITLSYHRNLSHRSFKLPKCLEYLFAYFGVFAIQGDPIDWVSNHKYHHQFIDTERDPHSPTQGFWFSQILWLMNSNVLTRKVNPKYFENHQERKINILQLNLKYGRSTNVSELEKQMFYRFIHKTYLLHPLAVAIALYALGGFPYLIWCLCVPVACGHHVTFIVNSVCHTWGKQPWKTRDLSKNNWWVALITFGEGWHNNHHAFETSARHGLEWWQIDLTWYIILLLQALGLATDVKLISEKQMLAAKTLSKSL